MKKLMLALLVLTSLMSCNSRIKGWELRSINSQCATRGGVEYINTVFGAGGVCQDGLTVNPLRGKT